MKEGGTGLCKTSREINLVYKGLIKGLEYELLYYTIPWLYLIACTCLYYTLPWLYLALLASNSITLYHGSTWPYLSLLKSAMALLGST